MPKRNRPIPTGSAQAGPVAAAAVPDVLAREADAEGAPEQGDAEAAAQAKRKCRAGQNARCPDLLLSLPPEALKLVWLALDSSSEQQKLLVCCKALRASVSESVISRASVHLLAPSAGPLDLLAISRFKDFRESKFVKQACQAAEMPPFVPKHNLYLRSLVIHGSKAPHADESVRLDLRLVLLLEAFLSQKPKEVPGAVIPWTQIQHLTLQDLVWCDTHASAVRSSLRGLRSLSFMDCRLSCNVDAYKSLTSQDQPATVECVTYKLSDVREDVIRQSYDAGTGTNGTIETWSSGLQHLSHVPSLRHLHLQGCMLADALWLPKLTQLTHLFLYDCLLGKEGVIDWLRVMTNLAKLPNLVYLDIDPLDRAPIDYSALSQWHENDGPLNALPELIEGAFSPSLSGATTRVDRAALEPLLHGNMRLRHLHLGMHVQITYQAFELVRSMPHIATFSAMSITDVPTQPSAAAAGSDAASPQLAGGDGAACGCSMDSEGTGARRPGLHVHVYNPSLTCLQHLLPQLVSTDICVSVSQLLVWDTTDVGTGVLAAIATQLGKLQCTAGASCPTRAEQSLLCPMHADRLRAVGHQSAARLHLVLPFFLGGSDRRLHAASAARVGASSGAAAAAAAQLPVAPPALPALTDEAAAAVLLASLQQAAFISDHASTDSSDSDSDSADTDTGPANQPRETMSDKEALGIARQWVGVLLSKTEDAAAVQACHVALFPYAWDRVQAIHRHLLPQGFGPAIHTLLGAFCVMLSSATAGPTGDSRLTRRSWPSIEEHVRLLRALAPIGLVTTELEIVGMRLGEAHVSALSAAFPGLQALSVRCTAMEADAFATMPHELRRLRRLRIAAGTRVALEPLVAYARCLRELSLSDEFSLIDSKGEQSWPKEKDPSRSGRRDYEDTREKVRAALQPSYGDSHPCDVKLE